MATILQPIGATPTNSPALRTHPLPDTPVKKPEGRNGEPLEMAAKTPGGPRAQPAQSKRVGQVNKILINSPMRPPGSPRVSSLKERISQEAEAAPVLSEPAPPVQVAEDLLGRKTDQDVVDLVRRFANAATGPASQQHEDALKELAVLLASPDFDFSTMSAANLALLCHGVPSEVEKTLCKLHEGTSSYFVKAKQACNERFKRLSSSDIAQLAKVASCEGRGGRDALAVAIRSSPPIAMAKLFVAVQKIEGQLNLHEDLFSHAVTQSIGFMDLEAFNFLQPKLNSLTDAGKNAFLAEVVAQKSSIERRLVKDLLAPIVTEAVEKDPSPEKISDAVQEAITIYAAFRKIGVSDDRLNKSDVQVALRNAMKNALKQAPYSLQLGELFLIFSGIRAVRLKDEDGIYLKNKNGTIKTKKVDAKNPVSEASARYGVSFNKEKNQETSNLKLVKRAVLDAFKS
jgi:hypothetical protein